MEQEEISATLIKAIYDRGITLTELCRRTSLKPELIRKSLYETRQMKASEFLKLCLFLGLDSADFVRAEES